MKPHSNPLQPGPARRTPAGRPAGVFDTIADAVTLVVSKPWLMIVPLVVNVLLWLGPKVSMGVIIRRMTDLVATYNFQDTREMVDHMRAVADTVFVSDAIGVLTPSMFTGIPLDSVMGLVLTMVAPAGAVGVTRDQLGASFRLGIDAVLRPESVMTVLLIGVVCFLLAMVALVLFRVPIARAVRGTSTSSLGAELTASLRNVAWYFAILIGGGLVVLMPFMLVTGMALMLGSFMLVITAFVVFVAGLVFAIYTWFTVDAMMMHQIAPMRAFRASWDMARLFFGNISFFIFIDIMVLVASFQLWGAISSHLPGMLLALLGNAFIGTTLAAASMMFYGDRYRLMRAVRNAHHRAQPGRR